MILSGKWIEHHRKMMAKLNYPIESGFVCVYINFKP